MNGGDTKLSELYGNSKMQNLSLIFLILPVSTLVVFYDVIAVVTSRALLVFWDN